MCILNGNIPDFSIYSQCDVHFVSNVETTISWTISNRRKRRRLSIVFLSSYHAELYYHRFKSTGQHVQYINVPIHTYSIGVRTFTKRFQRNSKVKLGRPAAVTNVYFRQRWWARRQRGKSSIKWSSYRKFKVRIQPRLTAIMFPFRIGIHIPKAANKFTSQPTGSLRLCNGPKRIGRNCAAYCGRHDTINEYTLM